MIRKILGAGFVLICLIGITLSGLLSQGKDIPEQFSEALSLQNDILSFAMLEPGLWVLNNKLTNNTFQVSTDPFILHIELDGREFVLSEGEISLDTTYRSSQSQLVMRYLGYELWDGLEVNVHFELLPDDWYIRKHIHITNNLPAAVTLNDAVVEQVKIEGTVLPKKSENPVFPNDQIFWGLEWPIAEPVFKGNEFSLQHFPAILLQPGESWTSKISGFGVSEEGGIKSAFGRYIQRIRANRVDFASLYFDWLCHDNSGPLESEILANFAVLKRMKDLFGLQFGIYNSDAGLVESMGTYFPQYKPIFDKRFPNGLKTIAEDSAEMGMKLGLWIGPDGFGETPEEMKARKDQLISWVRDFNVGLFKLDTVVSGLEHKDKYTLEKKYQALVDALAEIRRIDPSFVAINHRVNNSPYMLTITDCILWKGQETYNDVHITNTDAWLYNRVSATRRNLFTELYDVPFRLFEDHGVCFNTNIEKWDDEFVTQAFGRASVISPEMYGAFFFLRDPDFPRLARLIQLHKETHSILKGDGFLLEDNDIAHSSGLSSMLVLRNMTWESVRKTIPLDGQIGLTTAEGTPLTVMQRHPSEYILTQRGRPFETGDELRISLDPFEVKLIQVYSEPPTESYVEGINYNIIPRPDAVNFDIQLIGETGREYDLRFVNFEGKDVFDIDLNQALPIGPDFDSIRIGFLGNDTKPEYFSHSGKMKDSDPEDIDGTYLTERAKFSIDDDALEIREMLKLKENPSRYTEVEDCRDYMWEKVIQTHTYNQNAFDEDHSTRWSDGYAKRSPFTGTPQPYRSDSSTWRIDMGERLDLRRLDLYIVRRLEKAQIEGVEISSDLKTWLPGTSVSLPGLDEIPFSTELRRRSGNIRIHDVEAGDGNPVRISVTFPENLTQYIRIKGRDFSVSEIIGYDETGRPFSRDRWHATNFYGESRTPRRTLKVSPRIREWWPGQEIAVAVRAGVKNLDPVDGVYVVAICEDEFIVPEDRAPSYPYHNYEWNSSWLKREGLRGMTFRFQMKKEWEGKRIDIYAFLFNDQPEDITADSYVVTPQKPYAVKTLRIRQK
ncbi:hypothetical protein ACFLT9_10845 [Acidobacteriota bacterium]